ncbi:unnamed protein product [Ectocarpus sp. CCAP 1310/34]|nr:unnamed protein product [Ectocarpus sp. CCAP 1310/34]
MLQQERPPAPPTLPCLQAFPCEPRPLCTPEEKQHLPPLKDNAIEEEGDETPGDGGEGEGGKTVRELARLCYEDPCRGLLEVTGCARQGDQGGGPQTVYGLPHRLQCLEVVMHVHEGASGAARRGDPSSNFSLSVGQSGPKKRVMALLPKIASVIKSCAGQVSADGAQAGSDGGGGLGDMGSVHGAARATAEAAAVSLRPRAALSCLRVLCAVAGRAPWAAERVASEPGLLDAVREAFLEPRTDGTLPLDLSEAAPATTTKQLSPAPPQEPATPARAEGKARGGGPGDANGCPPPPPPQEGLALLAVRLARVLVQSGRGVALALSQTPLLGSTKGWLALGQGSRRPLPALEAVQREVLELWRCCLSYGIDVAAADTVVLVARGQGWWPGLSVGGVGGGVGGGGGGAPLVADTVTVERGDGGGGSGGGVGGSVGEDPTAATPVAAKSLPVGVGVGGARSTSGGASGGSRGGDSVPPRLAFYRALHQLACACVLPPGGNAAGRNKNDGAETAGGDGKAGVGAAGAGLRKEAEGFSVGGVVVVPESWADVGDTVDAAVEAVLLWLLRSVRGGGGVDGGGTAETAQQAAAVHLVACWMERYQAMSRTAGRRASGHLESIAEDAAVLFSSLLASSALPLMAAVAAAVTRGCDQSGGGGGGGGSGGSGDSGDSFSQRGVSSGEAVTAGLDWLCGVFRLGLACERAMPGEAAAALASAPEATAAALAAFLATAGPTAGAVAAGGALTTPTAAVAPPPATFLRRVRRAEAGARWLGCRLLALVSRGVGRGGGWPWAALRRDCALQAMALCERGDEAIAVGLLAEALPGSTVDSPAENGSERPSDDPAAAAGTAAASASLLRTLFRGAISDPVALSQSSFHLDGRWASLQSLKACAPPGTASLLPLPPHWLFLPLVSQGGGKAASMAVSACLSLLVELEREESTYVWGGGGGGGGGGTGCNPPEVKLYHLANACLYGASVLSGLGAVQNFDWLFSRYLEQCGAGFEGRLAEVIARLALASAPDPAKMIADAATAAAAGGRDNNNGGNSSSNSSSSSSARDRARAARRQSHAERALLEFVKDLVASFLADSFGLPSFARVLRVFVRTGFPVAARRVVWKELGDVGLLHLLDPPPAGATAPAPAAAVPSHDSVPAAHAINGGGCVTDQAYLYPPDVDGDIVEVYLTALEHPRFGPAAAAAAAAAAATAAAAVGERRRHGRVEETERGSALSARAAAATGLAVEAGRDDLSPSAAAAGGWAVTMREIAVHHLACYLFPPSPRPPPVAAAAVAAAAAYATAPAAPCPPECCKDDQGDPPWRPDFARRKMFQRLLREHRERLGRGRGEAGAGGAGSVAAAVLGHHGLGVDSPAVVAADGNRATEERPAIQWEGGARGREGRAWVSELGERRRTLLQAYCRACSGDGRRTVAVAGDGGGDGDGDGDGGGGGGVDVVSWLEEERHVEDVVERLAHEFCP